MKQKYITKLWFTSLAMVMSLLLMSSCSQQAASSRERSGSMDTPEFHVQRGDDALLNQRYEDARASYRKALSLKSDHANALSGLAVASAYEASRPGVSKATRTSTFEQAEDQIKKALKAADNDKERARIHSFAIRIYFVLQLPKDDWYENAEEHFEDAVDLDADNPAPYYFMGLAAARKLSYNKATELLEKVLALGAQYEDQANKELKRIQDIRRAVPGSQFGADVAYVEKITRADVAALFVAELRLDRIYKQSGQTKKSGYVVPNAQKKMSLDPLQKYPDAVDITGHPLEASIKEVIKLGVKGLGPDPAHKFYPDQEYKRAEFAQLLQDLLIKVTKDPSLATRYVGEASPFPDVNQNIWYYNATRTVVNRGLMTVNNKVTGDFEPMASVSGSEALLAIRNLKEILKSYLR